MTLAALRNIKSMWKQKINKVEEEDSWDESYRWKAYCIKVTKRLTSSGSKDESIISLYTDVGNERIYAETRFNHATYLNVGEFILMSINEIRRDTNSRMINCSKYKDKAYFGEHLSDKQEDYKLVDGLPQSSPSVV